MVSEYMDVDEGPPPPQYLAVRLDRGLPVCHEKCREWMDGRYQHHKVCPVVFCWRLSQARLGQILREAGLKVAL